MTLYCFVRQDIPIEQQLVQALHAVYAVGSIYGCDEDPPIVVIGMPDLAALHRVELKLKKHQIPHYCWTEPDRVVKNCGGLGMTAIATAPLSEVQRLPLANYRLWRYSPERAISN